MRRIVFLCGVGLVAAACSSFGGDEGGAQTSSPEGGTSGEDGAINGSSPDTAFALVPGTATVALVQGVNTKITVTIQRGKDQHSPVTISVLGLREGIFADDMTIPADQSSGEVEIKTPLSAAQGEADGRMEAHVGGLKQTAPLKTFVQGPPGSLDTTWGVNGKLDGYLGTVNTALVDLISTADDSFYAIGLCEVAPNDGTCAVHLSADGKVDTSYGDSSGRAFMPMTFPSTGALDSMGRVLILGKSPNAVMRLDTSGKPDTAFGQGNGIAPLDTSGLTGTLYDIGNMVVRDDGHVLVSWDNLSGSNHLASVLHLDDVGAPKADFVNQGAERFAVGSLVTLGIHKFGASKGYGYISWVGAPGMPTTYSTFEGFNTDTGAAQFPFTSLSVASLYSPPQYRLASAELSDGSVIFAVSSINGYYFRKVDAQGNAVTSFGAQGLAGPYVPIDFPLQMVVQDDGKFIVNYTNTTATGSPDLHIARFMSNGLMDSTFGDKGIVNTTLGCSANGRGIVLQKKTPRVIVGSLCRNAAGPYTLTAYWR